MSRFAPQLLILFALLPAASSLPAAAQEEEPDPSLVLRGLVVDIFEEPVTDAEISLRGTGGIELSSATDRRGRFTVPRLQPGRWGVRVTKPGFEETQGIVVLPRSTRLDLELLRTDDAAPETPPARRTRERGEALIDWGNLSDAAAHATGAQTVRLPKPSEGADLKALVQRVYLPGARPTPSSSQLDLENETFDLFVPDSYTAEEPHGLLVWISPTPVGRFYDANIAEVLKTRKLLFVGANNSGNQRTPLARMALALEAVQAARTLYSIDSEQVYVGGYSGGGRVASAVLAHHPEVFHAGLYWFGADHWEPAEPGHRPGASWQPAFNEPTRKQAKVIKRQRKMVFITGDRDFNRSPMRAIYRLLQQSGYGDATTFLQIPGADHFFGFNAEWLGQALDHVEE